MTHTHVAITEDGIFFRCATCNIELSTIEATQGDPEETGIALCTSCGFAYRIDEGDWVPNGSSCCANCSHC